jgi:hypothetical protein
MVAAPSYALRDDPMRATRDAYRRALTKATHEAAQRAHRRALAQARKRAAQQARERAVVALASSGGYPAVWDRVASCESGGRWGIDAEYDGGLQFAPTTWTNNGGGQYAPYAYLATPAEQVEIAQVVLAASGPGQWPVCSRVAGLTRENGG